jgi:spermidine synthase
VGVAGLLFFLSGASALVYQVSWQRILSLHSGIGLYSVAMIVAAFMAGLGLGSHLGGAASTRLSGRAALWLFGGLELAVGLMGVLSPRLYYDWLYPKAVLLPSPSWAAGLLHFLVLLPPTALMGMSLPVLVRAMVRRADAAGPTIGYLYGINVLGASAGAMLAPWVLIKHGRISGAVLAAAGGNGAAALGALLLGFLSPSGADAPRAAAEVAPAGATPERPGGRPFGLWLGLYALSGFFALSLEIVWFRLLEVGVKATAFTFGTVLAVYLLGSAVGCLVGAVLVVRLERPLRSFLVLQCLLLAASGVAVVGLVRFPAEAPVYRWFVAYWAGYNFFPFGHVWDPGVVARLYLALPAALFAFPTALMGLAFPVLQRAVHDDPQTSGLKVGALQAANIAGSLAGSLLVGLLALDHLGSAETLRLILAGGLAFAALGGRYYGRVFGLAAAALVVLVLALPGQDELWRRLHGLPPGPAVFIAEDATSVVALAPEGDAWRLSVNGKGNSWLPFGGIHTVLGALPALVHPAPRRVAIIGLGSGDTAWAAGCRKETRGLRVFEISAPEPRLLGRLAGEPGMDALRAFLADPRLRIDLTDGRHALEAEATRYDLLEADPTWPESAYSGNVYSLEFFDLCARRLERGGIFCTWAPTRRICATFRRAFPHVLEAVRGTVLLGSNDPLPLDREAWRARLEEASAYLGPERARDVRPRLENCRPALREAGPEVNRDLFPRDEFASP